MVSFIKSLLRVFCQDYRINIVVAGSDASPAGQAPEGVLVRAMTNDDTDALTQSPTVKMRSAVSYAQAGHMGFVLTVDNAIQCVAHFASPHNYDFASIWPLQADEMCLVNIATEQDAFGKGYAPMLIRAATQMLIAQGTRRVTAFIWWSNHPSRRAFAKAGWRMIGRSLEVKLFGRWLAFRVKTKN